MRFEILGPLQVSAAGEARTITSPNQRRLLAALLVHRGSGASIDTLIDAVWSEAPPPTGRKALHTYVARLRGSLDPGRVETTPSGYRLSVAGLSVDADEFLELLAAAGKAPDAVEALAHLDRALALWRGPAFGELADDPFARAEAARLEERRWEAIEDRFEMRLQLGDHAGMVGELEAFVAAHPLRERPVGQLMRALYASGRQADALATYQQLRVRLQDDLGLDPSPELRAVHEAVLRQEPAVSADVALPTTDQRVRPEVTRSPRRPPQPRTSLIGREEDVTAVLAALGPGRLVTITGTGGVGKTRLVLEVARRNERETVWCDLASLRDGDAVADTVASALAVPPDPSRPAATAVVEALAAHPVLLILDNAEHLAEAVAALTSRILDDAPATAVVATSRVRLGIIGERLWPLRPLPVRGTLTEARTAAEELFVTRAREVLPGFAAESATARAIMSICQQVDGLPLALELAASRVRALSPDQILVELGDRLALLTDHRRGDDRHRTLAGTLAWSYELLPAAARQLFERTGVFAAWFGIDLLEDLYRRLGDDPGRLVDAVGDLVDHSLLEVDTTASSARYHLLASVRVYARERLQSSGDDAAVVSAHAHALAARTTALDEQIRGEGEAAAIASMRDLLPDLRQAHRDARERGDVGVALELSAALHDFALFRLHDEAFSWGAAALDLEGAVSHPLFPVVCGTVANGYTNRGHLLEAAGVARRGLAEVPAGDARAARSLQGLAVVGIYEGKLDDAVRHAEEFLALAEASGDRFQTAHALMLQALAHTYRGDLQAASAAIDRQQQVAADLGNPTQLAWAAYTRGEMLALHDPDAAIAWLERADELARSVDNAIASGVARVTLATLHARYGDPVAALGHYAEVIEHWWRAADRTHLWTTLRTLSELLVRVGNLEAATVVAGAVVAASATLPVYGADAERLRRIREVAERELGSRFRPSWERGQQLAEAEVVAYALELTADPGLATSR